MGVPPAHRRAPERDVRHAGVTRGGAPREEVVPGAAAEAEVRIALTEVVQRIVETLRRQVSGDLLTDPGPGLQPPLPPPLQKRT